MCTICQRPSVFFSQRLSILAVLTMGELTIDRVWFRPASMDGNGPVDAETEMVLSLQTEQGLTPTQADEIAAMTVAAWVERRGFPDQAAPKIYCFRR